MMRLLWLCVTALGVRMLWEMTISLSLRWMYWGQKALRWAAVAWLVALIEAAVWHWRQP